MYTHDSLHPYHGKNLAASSMSRNEHGLVCRHAMWCFLADWSYIYIFLPPYPIHDSVLPVCLYYIYMPPSLLHVPYRLLISSITSTTPSAVCCYLHYIRPHPVPSRATSSLDWLSPIFLYTLSILHFPISDLYLHFSISLWVQSFHESLTTMFWIGEYRICNAIFGGQI